MLWAAENGKLSVVQELCNVNPNLVNARDADEYTPLHRACYNNHADVVKFLIDHNAQLNAKTEDGWQPLHSAARWGSFDAAQLLIDTEIVDINATTNGNFP
uniref:Uncharacterized protein n=1 Tax=Romanomermis culicivorax TaxID=13658 RepID=A0A915IJE7_ROMCU